MKKVVFLGFSLLVVLFFTRCTFKDDLNQLSSFATDSLKIVLGTPSFSHTIHFEVTDAATGDYITQDVKIKLSGAGAAEVYDNLGEQSSDSTYTAQMGILDLVLDPRLDSATLASNPISFSITPVVNGYISSQQTVQVSNKKFQFIPVSMINLSDAPSGVSVSQASLAPTYSGDQTSSAVVQQVDGTNTTIEVQPNTTLKNASGQVLKGNITSQVVFYSPTDPVAQNILSNSLTGPVKLENNSTVNSKLVSAGMYNAVLKVGSETVKTLNGEGLKLKTRVSADLINPNTGNPIQEGDTIQMWSKEQNSGTWKFEKNTVVKKDADGFYLEDVVNHLSEWNFDWSLTNSDFDSGSYYSTGPTINWKLVNCSDVLVQIDAKLNKAGVSYDSKYEYANDNSTTTLISTPKNVSGYLKFKDYASIPGRVLTFSPDSIPFTDLSPNNKYNVKITETSITYNANITLKIHSSDPTNKTIIMPTGFVNYSLAKPIKWITSPMKNGVINLQLLTDSTYTMLGIFGKKAVFGSIKLNDIGNNQLQFVFSNFGSSSGMTSDPIDKPATNETAIKFTYDVTLSAHDFGQFQKVARPIHVNE